MSSNTIQRVAIVGATGNIGKIFTGALIESGKHTVTALTRADGQGKVPEGVRAITVNYDDEPSIADALKHQQFLIIALGVQVADEVNARIVSAAGKAGVSYIMPNAFGYPFGEAMALEDGWSKAAMGRIEDVAKNGVSTAIPLSCGIWYEWSLALGEQWFGFTIKDRKATFFDDGKRVITVSTWQQCGRGVASLLSLPESGASPSLADFKTLSGAAIYSFRVCQRDMLDSLHRVLGTTDGDWHIAYEPVEQRIKDGHEEMKKGDKRGFCKILYGKAFDQSNELSDFAGTRKVANNVLKLPKEDLDEATKRAVDMVEGGWSPLAR